MKTDSSTPATDPPSSFYDETQIQSAIRCALREHREPASVFLRGPKGSSGTGSMPSPALQFAPPPPPHAPSLWQRCCAVLRH